MRRSSRLGLRPLEEIADAALLCFTHRGFRLTQMSDVGAELGMSPSAAYRYVESKEGLFHIAALRAAGIPLGSFAMPVAVQDLSATVAELETVVRSWPRWPVLTRKLARRGPDSEQDARAIAAELYDFLAGNWRLIALFDRAANDIPALRTVFTEEYRRPYLAAIVEWYARHQAGLGRSRPEAEALARAGIEAISWLAMRRRNDTGAAAISEANARDAAERTFSAPFGRQGARPA